MQMNRCVNCMEEIEGYPCPRCGFDLGKMSQPPFALPWNTILHGRYLVGKVLGQGGFGITYVGWDLLLDMKVAIKEYYPTGQATRQNASTRLVWYTTGGRAPEGEGGNAFLKEARKMAKIGGIPEIVRVLDTFCENETAYIVMEFVEGETLKGLAERNGTMSFDQCAQLLLPLLEGLGKVHAQGLIHRDISPDNIMRQADGTLRLLDFGAAKDTSVQKNSVSQLVAKHGFSPVEQYASGGQVGPWTDVYALCATMYYLLSGEAPPEALERLDRDTLDFSRVRAPLTEGQRAILAAGLAVRPENRTQSVDELAGQLKGLVPPDPPQPQPNNPKPQPKPKKKLIVGVCAAAVLAAAIWAVMTLLRPAPVTVEELGCTNAAKNSGSLLLTFPKNCFYYDDKDFGLYLSTYDKGDETFYIGTEGKEPLDERALFLNTDQKTVYYIHDGDAADTKPDTIYKMAVGKDRKSAVIKGGQYMYLQYARLSNGKEYLYYVDTGNGNEDNYLYQLFRYDLKTGKSERLLEEKIHWYNLDGGYLYYITFEDPSRGTQWKRATLDGKKPKVLNSSDSLTHGFIEDGTAYLFSLSKELLLQFDLEGNPVNTPLALYHGTATYGDGWLYYSLEGSGEVHRILPDGSNDTVILQGKDISSLCYENDYLWILEQGEVNGEVVPVQSFMVFKSGESVIEIDERAAQPGGLTPGVKYELKEDVLVLTDYTGTEERIIVPWEVAGVALSNIQTRSGFPDVPIYVYPQESELTWEKAEDGSGVILTGYDPQLTQDYPYLVLPDQVAGLPVVGIGPELLADDDALLGLILLDGVQTIGESAFKSCSALCHVELPDSITYISEWAFAFCHEITSLPLPGCLESIGDDAFFGCSGLTEIIIPRSATFIGWHAFHNCPGLRSAAVPSSCPLNPDAFESSVSISYYE